MLPHLHDRGIDCIAEFEAAAVQRHQEARDLLRRSRDLGAIYLYGYSVELRLKAAYFATPGVVTSAGRPFGPTDPITDKDRNTAVGGWAALGLTKRPNGHHLAFWAALLVARRATSVRPYPTGFGNLVVAKATELYLEWRETLRYRATRPVPRELRYVRERAEWVGRHYAALKQ